MINVTEAEILGLHRAHQDGESLDSIGRRLGCSHQAVRLLFLRHGLSPVSQAQRGAQRQAASARQAEAQRDHVIALYQQLGSVDAVSEQTALPRARVRAIVATLPDRERYRQRRVHSETPRERVLEDLMRAKGYCGEPLSVDGYRRAAKYLGLIAFDTVIRHFYPENPEAPWQTALAEAGVQGHAPRGRRANAISLEQCVAAVADCLREHDEPWLSLPTYSAWARQHDHVPSGASVRKIVGSWSLAVELALDFLAGHDIL